MVSRATVVELSDEHVAEAAELLAARHRAQRASEPGLDPAFEDATAARIEVEALRERGGGSGVAAVADGEVTGFLLGAPSDEIWGPNVWVPPAGQAVGEAELVRDLYAAAAARWVAEDRTSQYVVVPATDPSSWTRGSGSASVTSRSTRSARRPPPGGDGAPHAVTIRSPRREDLDVLARLDGVLPTQHTLSPVFARIPLPSVEERRAEWEKDFDDERFTTFVAVHHGEVVGSAVGCAVELSSTHTSLALPRGAAYLAFAAVFSERRGLGAGRALGERVVAGRATRAIDGS